MSTNALPPPPATGSTDLTLNPAQDPANGNGRVEGTLQLAPIHGALKAVDGLPMANFRSAPDDDSDQGKWQVYHVNHSNRYVKSDILTKAPQKDQLNAKMELLWQKAHSVLKDRFKTDPNGVSVSMGYMRLKSAGKTFTQADIYDEIKKLVKQHYPEAECIAIDFEDGSLRFLKDKKAQEIKTNELPKEIGQIFEYVQLWREVRELAMPYLEVKNGNWCTRYDMDVNRSVYAQTPFQIDHPAWEKFTPKTHESFLSDGHLGRLIKHLPEPLKAQAATKIHQTNAFVEALKAKLKEEIEKKQQSSHDIEQLKSILQGLEEVQIAPIYPAIVCSDKDTLTSAKNLKNTAEVIQSTMRKIWEAERSLNPDKIDFDPRALFNGKPDPEALKAYRLQIAGLICHSELDHMTICPASQKAPPSFEEFIVHNMLHIGTQDYEDDLRSLNMPVMEPNMQRLVKDIINSARQEALK